MKREPMPQWVADVLSELPALLTADEVATVLRCSRRSVTRMIQSGRLVALRPVPGGSSKILVPRPELGRCLMGMGEA